MKNVTICAFVLVSTALAACSSVESREPATPSNNSSTRNGESVPGDLTSRTSGTLSGTGTRSNPPGSPDGTMSGDTSPRSGSLTDPMNSPGATGMGDMNSPGATGSPGTGGTGDQPRAAARMSDGEIAAIMNAANEGEIEQGRIAQRTGNRMDVRNFAKMMVEHHTEARDKQARMASKQALAVTDNAQSRMLQSEGQKTLETLRALKSQEFDRAYIDAQVKAHRDVLSMLDSQLLPSVQSTEFKSLLQEMRPRIAQHLQMAEDLQKKLGGGAATGASNDTKTGTNPGNGSNGGSGKGTSGQGSGQGNGSQDGGSRGGSQNR